MIMLDFAARDSRDDHPEPLEEAMNRLAGLMGVFLVLAVTACNSIPLTIPSAPVGPNEQRLGTGEGRSTGIMVLGFIPINQNSRFVNAYQEALAQSGGTRLVDVTISERWFWAYVLNGYIFQVRGTGVVEKK
jgi:hypothetical protein